MLHLPFVLYADFESILEPKRNEEGADGESWTVKNHRHVADGFAVYTKCKDNRFYQKPYLYTGENAPEHFIDHVLEKATEIRRIYKNKISPIVTTQQKVDHNNATQCYLCHESFITNQNHKEYMNRKKVLDHCHLTGKYRGAAHSICNLQLAINPDTIKIPVILHNLKGYDSHLILSAAKKRHGAITCIPNNMEQYITFTIGDVTFIDSCQFMQSSLDQLVKNLRKSSRDLHINFPEVYKYLVESNKEFAERTDQDDSFDLNNSLDLFQIIEPHRQHPQNNIDMDGDDDLDVLLDQAGDYRSNPYQQPNLSDEQKEKVFIFMYLIINFIFIQF